MKKQYSFIKGAEKSIISLGIFIIPFLLTEFPDLANLSLGAIGTLIVNFLKIKLQEIQ
jgi:hypothetical protein